MGSGLKIGWAVEYAAQQDSGDNIADVDAHYQLAELKFLFPSAGITVGREVLSGERGTFDSATNPAFQTPLATLHPFQGWADKFTTTRSDADYSADTLFTSTRKFWVQVSAAF